VQPAYSVSTPDLIGQVRPQPDTCNLSEGIFPLESLCSVQWGACITVYQVPRHTLPDQAWDYESPFPRPKTRYCPPWPRTPHPSETRDFKSPFPASSSKLENFNCTPIRARNYKRSLPHTNTALHAPGLTRHYFRIPAAGVVLAPY
jgi:hypothetical protein